MISSVFTLKESDNIPEYLVPSMETKLEENYYMNSSLNFLLECHEELLSCRRNFYKTILEESEENPYIINESFNEILSKIKTIIKKILAYIESLIKRFITHLAKFVKSDKYIIKMRKEIQKFPKDKSFRISGYNFTFDNNVPAVDVVGLDLSEVRDKVNNISGKDVGSRIGELSDLVFKLSDEANMDDIRGQILNVDYSISETGFGNEVFSIFRDGKSEEDTIEIKKEDVNNALREFDGYNNKIKEIKTLKHQISNKYKTLESQIESLIKANIDSDKNSKIDNAIGTTNYSSDTIYKMKTNLDNLLTIQANQIQRIANLHVQAVSAKLDAYNASVVQDRNILYRALSIVQKDIDNTFIMGESGYDYTREGNYRGYVLEKYFMDQNQKRFVDECLLLSESRITELKTIHEDLKMDKKSLFEKIKELVKTLFQKFMMKMNKFFTTDKTFLEKYKNIILTKKVEEYTLNDMPDYEAGIKNIIGYKFKVIDIKGNIDKTELQIQQEQLSGYTGNDKFSEYANRFYLSNNDATKPRDVKSTELKIAELYAFCTGANAAIKKIESEFDTFYKEADKVKNEVLKVAKDVKTESVSLYGEKYYYSTVLESFINEEEQQPDKGAKETPPMKLDVAPQDKDTQAKDNADIDKKVDLKKDGEEKDAKTQADENKGGDAKKIEETGKWYLNTIKTMNLAKVTAFQKIYKEYMRILRHHVQKATGSLGSASKFTEDDVKEIRAAMKDYVNAKDDNGRKPAIDRIINIYKSRNMVIDAHDVQNLVDKNKNNLG